MDFQLATETERLIQLEQAQIRRLERVREELVFYATQASETRKRREAIERGEIDPEEESIVDFVEHFY